MSVLVAATAAPYKADDTEHGLDAWLTHAEAWADAGHRFFLAAELKLYDEHDAVAKDPRLMGIYRRMDELGGEIWHFGVDDGARTLTSQGRLVRICTGRNLAMEYFCNRPPYASTWDAILFLDTDVEPPPDAVDRLLEVDRQLVGFEIPTYCLDGPRVTWDGRNVKVGEDHYAWRTEAGVETWPRSQWTTGTMNKPYEIGGFGYPTSPFPEGADVREHWNTAGALMVRPEAARVLRWRWDLQSGSTDDPCFQADAVRMGFGQTWVRHDVRGRHYPDVIMPLERRELDLTL